MTYEAQVQAARTPQEALLVIAHGIDAVLAKLAEQRLTADEWGEWRTPPVTEVQTWDDHAAHLQAQREYRTQITGDEEHTEVVLLGPSEERMEQRRLFERQRLRLSEHLGTDEDWNEVYAKGGPRWLYYGNRELFMSFPEHTRAVMVADVIEDSPEEAQEIGRDALKQAGETGPGSVGMRVADEFQGKNLP